MQLRKEKTLHSKCCEINELIEWIVINCNCIKPLTGYLEKPVNKYICLLFKKLVHRYTWCTVDVIPIPTSIPIPSQSNSGYRSPHNQTTQLEIFIRFSCQTSHKSRPRYIYIHPHTRTHKHSLPLLVSLLFVYHTSWSLKSPPWLTQPNRPTRKSTYCHYIPKSTINFLFFVLK